MSVFLAISLTLAAEDPRPNVVLIIADDVSWNDVGVNSEAVDGRRSGARTPSIDALAAAGRNFTNAYLVASSCSPSRTSVLTGRYPHNNGRGAELHGARPAALPTLAGQLRRAGYHAALSGKDHMPADPPPETPASPFDEKDGGKVPGHSGGEAKWAEAVRDAPADRPFFLWLAAYDAHRGWDADRQWDAAKYGPKHDPADLVVPPYLVDDQATREDLASYFNEITRFDWHVGEVVRELESRGDLENTLILVMADNGRPFPRAKTRLHDSGMKTFLVAHWPAGITAGGKPSDALISSIDIAPTVLSLAGADVPQTVQGVSFAAALSDPAATAREAAFSEHNWHDYAAHARAVRADGFLYIRNNRPNEAMQGPADSVRSPSHQSLQRLSDPTAAQADTLRMPRPAVELYATATDPLQLENLAGVASMAPVETKMAGLLDRWTEETADSVPADLSEDSFDRQTGERTVSDDSFRGTPPGGDRGAETVNAPGPR